MMKNLLFFATAIAFVAVIALKPASPVTDSNLKGTVYHHTDSSVIKSSEVRLFDSMGILVATVVSDSAGRFEFASVAPGTYYLKWMDHGTEMVETVVMKDKANYELSFYSSGTSEMLDPEFTTTDDEKVMFTTATAEYETKKTPAGTYAPSKDIAFMPAPDRGDKLERKAESPKSKTRGSAETAFDMGGGSEEPVTKSGTLTAGEINDFAKWKLWEDLTEKEFNAYQNTWQLYLKNRYPVQITFDNGTPVVDAEVKLINKNNEIVFIGRTDNTGRAELWADLVPGTQDNTDKYQAMVVWNKKEYTFKRLKEFPNGWNNFTIKAACNTSNIFDIAFVVDATGSMGDEINYLKAELLDVINRAKTNNSDLTFRLASVFYKDHGDDYLTRKSDFNSDASQTINFIKKQTAGGGGDFPEAVDDAIDVALNQLTWSPTARGRIMFLVLDAPPHQTPEIQAKMQKLLLKASAMGVRIIPVTGSGIDKGVEFLMRSLALTTGGTYVFLTDDSGVGGKHIAPSTDKYNVEKLNDLMVRLINQYAVSTGCTFVPPVVPVDTTQTAIDTSSQNPQNQVKELTMNCYPNPTTGPIRIDVSEAGGIIYIADIHGRYLFRIDMTERKSIKEELSQLSAGTYFVKYKLGNREVTEKIVVVH